MSIIDNIEAENWERDEDIESASTTNMVTKEVRAFRWNNYFIVGSKTKVGTSVELYVRRDFKSRKLVDKRTVEYDQIEEEANNLAATKDDQEVLSLLSDTDGLSRKDIKNDIEWSDEKTDDVLSRLLDIGYVFEEEQEEEEVIRLF